MKPCIDGCNYFKFPFFIIILLLMVLWKKQPQGQPKINKQTNNLGKRKNREFTFSWQVWKQHFSGLYKIITIMFVYVKTIEIIKLLFVFSLLLFPREIYFEIKWKSKCRIPENYYVSISRSVEQDVFSCFFLGDIYIYIYIGKFISYDSGYFFAF